MMNYKLRRYGGIQPFLLTIMHIPEGVDKYHKVPELGQLDCRLRLTLLTCKLTKSANYMSQYLGSDLVVCMQRFKSFGPLSCITC